MTHSYHSSSAGGVAAHSSNSSNSFQMPSYTSHTSRGPGTSSPGRSKKTQPFFGGVSASSMSPGKPPRLPASKASSQLDSDQSLLEMLSSTVACLKQKHMDLEALGCLEQSLWLKRRMFGVDNSVVQRALNEVVLSYNSVAMQYLAQTQFDQCLAMLRKAEAITAPGNFKKCQSLQILTFNNIGCCYRKLGKLKSALKYLKEAAQIGSTCAHVKNLSITHLNLCAIQSQLGRHDLALEHAQAAIFHTQEELVSMEAAGTQSKDSRDEDGECEDEDNGSADVLDAKSREEKIISLAVAYHNLAVELEFNGRGEASLQWYKKALQLVWKYRDSNAALCASFKKIFMDAKRKLEMQRAGGGNGNISTQNNTVGGGGSNRPSSSNGRASQQSTTSSVSSRSSNAFSGGDRRKQIPRPKSAHYQSSRSGGGGIIAPAASDLSYSANVASQCYKYTKPSSAGLQCASPPKAASQPRRGNGGVRSRAAVVPRPLSATSSRQRPLSASAARSSGAKYGGGGAGASGDLNLEPNIEVHWKKLEKEFSIENANNNSGSGSSNITTRNYSSSQQQHHHHSRVVAGNTKRPQSARLTRSSSQPQQQRPSLNQYGNLGLDGDEDDDDYGVVDDDEPSEDEEDLEDDLDCEQNDDFADLLLRRNEKQNNRQYAKLDAEAQNSQQQQLSGREHRHRQALGEARRKANDFESENEGEDDNASSGEHSLLVRGAGDEESDLPNQRVGHMEYLRRMKRLAENIKDDLTGNHAVSVVAVKPLDPEPSSTQQRKLPPRPVSTTASRRSGTNAHLSVEQGSPDATAAARRGSTSKVRERLERVRNESVDTLSRFEHANDEVEPSADDTEENMVKAEADVNQTSRQEEFVEVVQDSAFFCATEQELSVAEQNLIRMAAAKHVQAFLRGERARAEARERRQRFRENQAALQIQTQAKQFVQHAKDQRLEHEQELLAQTQQLEIENLAASAIQQIYRQKFLPNDDSTNSQSMSPVPSRRQSEPSAITSEHQAPDSTRRRDSAAAVIQAMMKGFFTRELVMEHRAAQLSRQYIERKHMEVTLDHVMAMEQTFLEQLSATKIQALVRGRQSRFLVEVTKIGLNTAAAKIQGSFRSHHRNVQSSTDVGVRSVAARSIQQMVRRYLHRQIHLHRIIISGELSEVQHIAATSLQRFWRQAAARRELLLEELEAATCIQALGRGHLARKSFQSLRESSSHVGLSKPPSAFSISVVALDVSDEDHKQVEMTGEIGSGRHNATNLSFLPAAIREMYLEFVNSPSYSDVRAAAEQQQKAIEDADRQEMADLGLTFEDLVLELETCGDVVTACFALNALRMLVLTDDDRKHQHLTNAIKVARVVDQRIQDQEIWTRDVQQGSLWLLDVFHDLLFTRI